MLNRTTALSFFEFYRYGKACKLPFKLSDTVASPPLELVHSDVWGPAHTNSVIGFRCYVLFIDELPKYTWLFPSLYGSDVFETFRFFKLQIEILLSLKITKFRSHGGEYMSSRFQLSMLYLPHAFSTVTLSILYLLMFLVNLFQLLFCRNYFPQMLRGFTELNLEIF